MKLHIYMLSISENGTLGEKEEIQINEENVLMYF